MGISKIGLSFRKTCEKIVGFADADWGTCAVDRKSYIGCCFIFARAAVSGESKKQRTVALSTAEAEYMSLTEASKEAIHLNNLAAEMGFYQEKIIILNDNQAAQSLVKNPVISSKSKHISIKEHFIRDVVLSGKIEIHYEETEEMVADIFTKALQKNRHIYLRECLGLLNSVTREGECWKS